MDGQRRIKMEFRKSNRKLKSIGITVNNQACGYTQPFRGVAARYSRIVCVAGEQYISEKKNTAGLIINHGDFLAARIIYNTLKHDSLR